MLEMPPLTWGSGSAVAGLGFLELGLDEDLNVSVDGDSDLSTGGARARTLVIRAREDLEIARQVRLTLSRPMGV
jgi:acetate kinase